MEDQTQKWKPQGGFWLWLLVTLGFVAVDILGTQFLWDATAILLIDSLVRIIFGVLSVWLLVKYFDKGSWRNVIHGKNLGAALLAGGGVILLILMETIILFTKTPVSYWQELRSVPWQLLFAELICQQVTTGFFEESADRALLMEGYYQHGERSGKRRLLYSLIIFVDSSWRNHSLRVGLLSVPASFIQLMGYGLGFLKAWGLRSICGRDEELQAFRKTFYK